MFDSITHIHKRSFLAAFSECGIVREAAELAGISREAHYDWKAHDQDYAEAFEVATRMAADALEDEAIRRAKVGSSDKMLMFMLSAAKPDKYARRTKNEHSGAIAVAAIDLSKYTDEELQILARLANKTGAIRPRVDPGGDRTTGAIEEAQPAYIDVPGLDQAGVQEAP